MRGHRGRRRADVRQLDRAQLEYTTMLFSSRPVHTLASSGTCDALVAEWWAASESMPIAPASFCDTYLPTGEEVTSASACGTAPVPQTYGEVGYLSYVLYEYQRLSSASSVPALRQPLAASEEWCVLVDGVPVARPATAAAGEFASLGLDVAGGYHTVEVFTRTAFGAPPQSVTIRQTAAPGEVETIGATDGLCAGPAAPGPLDATTGSPGRRATRRA